jgi:hypothetical protein
MLCDYGCDQEAKYQFKMGSFAATNILVSVQNKEREIQKLKIS